MILGVRPLVTSDAAGLTAPIQAAPFYQPAFIAETGLEEANETPMPTGLTDPGNVWRIIFELASPMPGFVVYPYAFSGNLIHDTAGAFGALFENEFAYQLSVAQLTASRAGWQTASMDEIRFLGPIPIRIQAISPPLRGFPIRPRTPGGGGVGTRVGELSLTIDTPDVTATANTSLDFDFRLLLFPEAARDNAGYYTPMLFFHTQ